MQPIKKLFISPDDLRLMSYQLADQIIADGWRPDWLVGIWRGGAPVGCYVHEYLKCFGINCDHIAIRTSLYEGIDKTTAEVKVHSLSYLVENLTPTSKVLFVDDILESGRSMAAIFTTLQDKLGDRIPIDIRIATIFIKNHKNISNHRATYFIKDTTKWIVFPHELEELSLEEIEQNMGSNIATLIRNRQQF